MKKILTLAATITIVASTVFNVVSCNIGDSSTRDYLETFEDFDWSKGQTQDGDGYNWKYDDFVKNGMKLENSQLNQISGIQGPVDNIFNYDIYSTSYKGANFVKKQATTGAPVIKSYRPNGNKWLDFGLSSKARKHSYINSILNWNDGSDLDLYYNQASYDLRGRNYVAKNSVKSQQKDTFFNMFHDPSNASSSMVGTKNPFGGNLSNLSYIHEMYTWPAITNKGWITASFADYTDYMHKNGIPVLGLWYMSGWEDLTRESLKNLLEKNSKGDFKIVDILIEQCLKYNFDGWMINNEANGSQGDGYVIKNSEINEIMHDFNKRAIDLESELGKRLHIVYYTNDGTLDYDPVNNKPYSKKTIDAARYASEMQLDFTITNDVSNFETYLNNIWNGDESKRKTIYSLLNESTNIPGVGNYDVRNLIFEKTKDENGNINGFGKANNSFSIFGSGGANEYAKDFKNYYLSTSNKKNDDYKVYLMQQEVSNLYSGYQFFGSNSYLENNADGYDKLISQGKQSIAGIYQNDPRLKYEKFDKKNNTISYEFSMGDIGKENEGKKINSYGIGNVYWEKTVVADSVISNDYSQLDSTEVKEIENDPTLETYFSTGSGIQFVNRDFNGLRINDKIYPWTNSRLADVSPTYQWDFWSSKENPNTTKVVTSDGIKNVSKITNQGQLTGYYDYYDAYQKGNSLAIGMGYDFDKEGTVKPGNWENNPYYWNIMGSNLQNNDYTVSFYVKSTDEDTNKASSNEMIKKIAENTKITVITSELTSENDDAQPIVLESTVEENQDGWYKISSDLSKLNGISKDKRIAKLGIEINPGENGSETPFIFNVGGFKIDKNNTEPYEDIQDEIVNIKNEYIVKRKSSKNNINIRFNWNDKNQEAVDYYQVYYSTDKNNWYRVGQTSQNRYYLRELDESSNENIYVGVQPKYKNGKIGKINFADFSTKYNYK
ncbi:endo-beta-N-acetylglucosaminidase [Mesoplasma melaleucae]|uniref:Endo-beta-N-acetylglucosaminidase n=1 Tax=Mesoplasma melaleucae TaxID=81459 RepID=A0A2K8NWQ2_9MOLU|nr:hypothetical protein [Mesoplasma melaleucae]ATZ18164.1 endo-beta-N-acetylglucosaminidase [Mesoplasma melaleucae]